MPKTDTFLVLVSGFTQNDGKPTGMLNLFQRLTEFRSPTTSVELLPWYADFNQKAENILLCASTETRPKIMTVGYSYGGGWGLTQLHKQLKKRGLVVGHAIYCDAVYRSGNWLTAWRSLVPYPFVRVADNVRHVSWLRQKQGKPMGHDLYAESPQKTYIEKPICLNCEHVYMDDAQTFHNLAYNTVLSITRKK